MDVILRLALPSDLAAVDALFAGSYARLLRPDYPPSVMVTALPLLSRAQPGLLASGRYWLALEPGGQVVAAGGWSPAGGEAGEVRHMVTRADRLRRGLGRAVLGRAMAQAAEAGVREWIASRRARRCRSMRRSDS